MKRRLFTTVVLVPLVVIALWPYTAHAAGCDLADIPCYVDSALYPKLINLAESIWLIDRGGLQMARWIESVREWLIGGVLGSAFGLFAQRVQFPFYLAAIVAWMVFIVGYMLQAVVNLNWVDLKKAIRNGLFAILVFTLGSVLISWSEQVRVTVGNLFQTTAETAFGPDAGTIKFYAKTDTIGLPNDAVYGPQGATCTGMDMRRKTDTKFLSDYAANFLLADAADIHCPDNPMVGLPKRSGTSSSFSNVYINTPADPVENPDDDKRNLAFQNITGGIFRLIQGIPLVIAAIVEQVMYTLFALALAATWFSLTISLLFSLFTPTEGMLKQQVDAIIGIIKASWLASFWMGGVLALISAAALTGSGLAVVGVGILALGVVFWQCKQAVGSAMSAATAIESTAGGAPSAVGGALGGFRNALTTGAMVAGAVATGGAGAVATMAARQVGRDLANKGGGGVLGRAAGRVLADRTTRTIGQMAGRAQQNRAQATATTAYRNADTQDAAESSWYESRNYADAGTPAADARSEERIQVLNEQRAVRRETLPAPIQAEVRASEQTLAENRRDRRRRVLDRKIDQARKRQRFGRADRLLAERQQLTSVPAQQDTLRNRMTPTTRDSAASRAAPPLVPRAVTTATTRLAADSVMQDARGLPIEQQPAEQADRRSAAFKRVHQGARQVARLKREIATATQRGDTVTVRRLNGSLSQARANLAAERRLARPAAQPDVAAEPASSPVTRTLLALDGSTTNTATPPPTGSTAGIASTPVTPASVPTAGLGVPAVGTVTAPTQVTQVPSARPRPPLTGSGLTPRQSQRLSPRPTVAPGVSAVLRSGVGAERSLGASTPLDAGSTAETAVSAVPDSVVPAAPVVVQVPTQFASVPVAPIAPIAPAAPGVPVPTDTPPASVPAIAGVPVPPVVPPVVPVAAFRPAPVRVAPVRPATTLQPTVPASQRPATTATPGKLSIVSRPAPRLARPRGKAK